MLRTFRDRAIVLRCYNLGEADRIVVMLGQTEGQFRAVAKGVRRTSSRVGARLESFNLVDVQCHRSLSSGLHTVTQVESLRPYSAALASDFDAYSAAKAVVEVAAKLTDEELETNLAQFRLLEGALHALANRRMPAVLAAGSYMLRATAIEGWAPHLGSCAVCGKTPQESRGVPLFSPALGGQICEDCAPISSSRVQESVLELLEVLARADWNAAARFPSETWVPACDLAAAWTEWHLEHRLKTRAFLRMGDR